ncbi:hypothetical protein [Aureibacter tunicatorum]|uniref:Phosphate-selective porin O and P n=1 Tax=Aureibacter tunicatorum TaxID=866807 RepID=A0AAE4BQ53_9BACT|nr:hypothetical protein [Aureibacter tunicatorum]MDR6238734.1 hypothetical protein [Aureibacter tunicatorum]BDD05335.1 hypothetical protein AUTU_28180 [Aureibacter tunicatorum]
MVKKYFSLLAMLLSIPLMALADGSESLDKKSATQKTDYSFLDKGVKVFLDKEKQSSVKFGLALQFWARYLENNPGTLNENGDQVSQFFDLSMRRMRFNASVNLKNNVFFYTQLGTNNQAFNTDPHYQMFIHDFWTMFRVWDDKLYIGAGKHYFNGISRMSSTSSFSYMTLDNPLVNFPMINREDDFGRQLGIFAIGTIGRLGYRMALNKPYVYSLARTRDELEDLPVDDRVSNLSTEIQNNTFSGNGYFFWQFQDVVKSTSSFFPMSYIGSKRVLNLGAGFTFHPRSMASFDDNKELKYHDQVFLGVDLFLSEPLKGGAALDVYSVWYHYDFGPNYLRSAGIIPVDGGQDSEAGNLYPQGSGHRYYVIGTGDVWYTSAAYKLPDNINGWLGKLQPFAAFTLQNFEGLNDLGTMYDIGVNYLFYKQKIKMTAQYTLRPLFEVQDLDAELPTKSAIVTEHKGQFIFQLQFVL